MLNESVRRGEEFLPAPRHRPLERFGILEAKRAGQIVADVRDLAAELLDVGDDQLAAAQRRADDLQRARAQRVLERAEDARLAVDAGALLAGIEAGDARVPQALEQPVFVVQAAEREQVE